MLVEIFVAVAIITASILAASAVTQKSIQVARQAFHTSQAAFLLEEGAEAVRVLRDNGWNNISSLAASATYYPAFSGGTWTLSSAPNTVDSFTRTVTVANVLRNDSTGDISSSGTLNVGTKLVTVTVSWQEGSVTVSKTLSFYIMDIFS